MIEKIAGHNVVSFSFFIWWSFTVVVNSLDRKEPYCDAWPYWYCDIDIHCVISALQMATKKKRTERERENRQEDWYTEKPYQFPKLIVVSVNAWGKKLFPNNTVGAWWNPSTNPSIRHSHTFRDCLLGELTDLKELVCVCVCGWQPASVGKTLET